MSPEVASRVITLFREIRPPERSEYELTPHELRLLKLLVEGHNYTTASEELGVSYNTVKFHMRHIYEKLQVHSKSEAVAKAMRERLPGASLLNDNWEAPALVRLGGPSRASSSSPSCSDSISGMMMLDLVYSSTTKYEGSAHTSRTCALKR